MYRSKRFLGVIPARGGSKGIRQKNIHPLGGRPLIAYTANQVTASTLLDATVVSTDDDSIAAVARSCGLRVVARPSQLALDSSPTEPSLLHALDTLEATGDRFDFVVVLEPTSPFRTPSTIDGAIRCIVESGRRSLLAVRETYENIGFLEGGLFRPIVPGAPRRRQERRPFYVESSTIYICSVDHLRNAGTLVTDEWAAFVVSEEESLDINTYADMTMAECLATRKET
jgi:CMP-N,N'-diacetyllegionaminic acid synthase